MSRETVAQIVSRISPEIAAMHTRQIRISGLKLAARALLLSESWHRTPADRNAALATAERLIEKHGPVRDGWMDREVERQRVDIEASEEERASFCASLGPDRTLPCGWSLWDVSLVARGWLSNSGTPLIRPEPLP